MRIGMTSFGADGGKSGISQYVIQLLRQFGRCHGDNEIDLFVYDDEQQLYPRSNNIRSLLFPQHLRSPLQNIAWHQFGLQRWCRKRNHDVLFLPAGNRRLPHSAPCPTVGTVHDLSTLRVRGKYDWSRSMYIRYLLPRFVRRLTRILTISESSKRDIVEHVGVSPERVIVSPLAVDRTTFHPRDRQECRAQVERWLGVRGPFILYISRIEHPGKNHIRLIHAFNQLKLHTDLPHRLLLVGSDWSRATQVHSEAAASPFADQITMPGFMPGTQLPMLYNAADLHVFPSLYEGFGLPVLEAMASGVPTACSNCSSLPEVAGDAAVLFDPEEVDSIEAAMKEVLLDSNYSQELVRRGHNRAAQFTWERTARQTLAVLEEAAGC